MMDTSAAGGTSLAFMLECIMCDSMPKTYALWSNPESKKNNKLEYWTSPELLLELIYGAYWFFNKSFLLNFEVYKLGERVS